MPENVKAVSDRLSALETHYANHDKHPPGLPGRKVKRSTARKTKRSTPRS